MLSMIKCVVYVSVCWEDRDERGVGAQPGDAMHDSNAKILLLFV